MVGQLGVMNVYLVRRFCFASTGASIVSVKRRDTCNRVRTEIFKTIKELQIYHQLNWTKLKLMFGSQQQELLHVNVYL